MTVLLEEAIKRLADLPQQEQDAIASQIIDTLDDEKAWNDSFQKNPGKLLALADAALEEHRLGKTRPLDELLD